jgi:isocitrate dehydrogenase (NAD+)
MKEYLTAFQHLIEEQQERLMTMSQEPSIDFTAMDSISVGLIDGDGIGPIIMKETMKVLSVLLEKDLEKGKVQLVPIDGLTLENRLLQKETLPLEVLEKINQCQVLLKGPTTTPDNQESGFNLESANVALRRELDLYANVRPVSIPEKNINWIFYRENTEGEYVLGSKGLNLGELAVDFKVITDAGTRRIARAAFEYAQANGNLKVSIVTKANIMKQTDGKFLEICYQVAQEYPEVPVDDWYVDIMAANLIHPDFQSSFQVILAPNLYGDILTDEAAQIQGGVGTAGSANIGSRFAMFEAIHGSAPRMVELGIEKYANPASLMKAAEMMLRHIHRIPEANILRSALESADNQHTMTGNETGDTAAAYTETVLQHINQLKAETEI